MEHAYANLKGRGLQLALLTMAITAGAYAKVALGPLQESIRAALNLSDNQMALLQGMALALPTMVVSVPLGLIIDRVTRIRLVSVFAAILLVGSILTALARDFTTLFLARSLVGIAVFALGPVTFSLRTDFFAPAERGRAGMVALIGQFVGVSVVFGLGGVLVAGFGSGPDAWRAAMFWLTAPILAVILISTLALVEPPRSDQHIARPSLRQSFIELWAYRRVVVPMVAGAVLTIIALQSVLVWTPPTLMRSFGLAADRVGAIMALALPLGGIAGTIAGGVLADICQRTGGPRRAVLAAALLAASCLPLCAFPAVPHAMVASILLVLLIGVLTAVAIIVATISGNVLPNEIRGLYAGASAAVIVPVSIGLAPLLVSGLSGAFEGETAIGVSLAITCAVASMLSAATLTLTRGAFPR